MGGGAALVVALTAVLFLVSKQGGFTPAKAVPFECGFVPAGRARAPFSIQFFLISLVFLVFDIELILLFPLLVHELNTLTLRAIGYVLFVIIMRAGFFWEWSQGSLE